MKLWRLFVSRSSHCLSIDSVTKIRWFHFHQFTIEWKVENSVCFWHVIHNSFMQAVGEKWWQQKMPNCLCHPCWRMLLGFSIWKHSKHMKHVRRLMKTQQTQLIQVHPPAFFCVFDNSQQHICPKMCWKTGCSIFGSVWFVSCFCKHCFKRSNTCEKQPLSGLKWFLLLADHQLANVDDCVRLTDVHFHVLLGEPSFLDIF